jgi:DNA-directed RNA polymerase sigma subunit (sigma70/sigma32)
MNEDEQHIESYLGDLAKIPSLTEEEIRQLIQSRATALQQVVQAHLYLVEPITKEYMGQGKNQVDLILKGNLGLVHAVETFDTTTQESFSSYAIRSIRTTINQEMQP